MTSPDYWANGFGSRALANSLCVRPRRPGSEGRGSVSSSRASNVWTESSFRTAR
jgi:hypothetical protein